jgi:uncharacterized protein YheU (UPF0270 family)
MEKPSPPVEVPLEALDPDTCRSLIESFILREGTDYGASEVSLEQKISQVRRQLEKGEVKIIFDPASESVDLMTVREFRQRLEAFSRALDHEF